MASNANPLWHKIVMLSALAFVVAAALTATIGTVLARDQRQPSVTVLSSGNRLSVLVTVGDARMLIATGRNPNAFANALDRARPPTSHRIDVLLLAGNGEDSAAGESIRRHPHVRYVAPIEAWSGLADPNAVGRRAAGPPTPVRFQLPEGVFVTIEIAQDGAGETAWRAIVSHGGSTVVILSDGEDAAQFPRIGPVSALVLVGENPAEALKLMRAEALFVNAEIMREGKLRDEVVPEIAGTLWVTRVFSGEVARIDFMPGGVRIPASAQNWTALLLDEVAPP